MKIVSHLRLTATPVIAGIITLVCSGCAALVAGSAGAGTVAYVMGDSETVVDATVAQVEQAAQEVVDDLSLIPITKKSDKTAAVFTVRNAQDTKITITIKSLTAKTSKIQVRFGMWGDERQSGRILNDITKRL